MTDLTPDAIQHFHACAFCPRTYPCIVIHQYASYSLMEGRRCCSECRAANVRWLDNHEKRRRRALYVG